MFEFMLLSKARTNHIQPVRGRHNRRTMPPLNQFWPFLPRLLENVKVLGRLQRWSVISANYPKSLLPSSTAEFGPEKNIWKIVQQIILDKYPVMMGRKTGSRFDFDHPVGVCVCVRVTLRPFPWLANELT